MLELLRMWFMMIYLRFHIEKLSHLYKTSEPKVEEMRQKYGDWWAETIDAISDDEKLTAPKTALVMAFMMFFYVEYWRNWWKQKKHPSGFSSSAGIVNPKNTPEHPKHYRFCKKILNNCLSKDYAFLEPSKKDSQRVFMTPRGEQFATIFGLVREEFIYLKPFGSVVFTLFGTGFIWVVLHLPSIVSAIFQ